MKNNKTLFIIIASIIILIGCCIGIIFNKDKVEKFLNKDNSNVGNENIINTTLNNNQEEKINYNQSDNGKVDIIDVNSNSRPYAVVVNNTAVAVKVQEGLNKAYVIYEIPTEGNTSRLLALYKDIQEDLVIGTITSARHDFIDYALESDAIFCCFGWSHYAEKDMKAGSIDYLQGLFGYPYYRNNPENLVTEHTAYTSMSKLKDAAQKKGFKTTTQKGSLLKYNTGDVDLSTASNVKQANIVTIPYGAAPQIASFKYNEKTKMYVRYENSNKCIDHNTKEDVTTKNIIVQKSTYSKSSDNYYWDLNTTGSGEGYFITNGYAVAITWSKENRSSKTKYCYAKGTIINGQDVGGQEIEVSDGRTWIEIQTKDQKLTIN